MLPATYNLQIYCGDTCRWQFKLWTDLAKTQPADLTGVAIEATIRDKLVNGSYMLILSTIPTLPNIIDMSITASQSLDLPYTGGVWDMQLTYPSGDLKTVLRGTVLCEQGVSNPHPEILQLRRIK